MRDFGLFACRDLFLVIILIALVRSLLVALPYFVVKTLESNMMSGLDVIANMFNLDARDLKIVWNF